MLLRRTATGRSARAAGRTPPARDRSLRALVDGHLGDDPHRVRPVRPPGVRLLARAPAARERADARPVPGRHRGHPRRGPGRRPSAWSPRPGAARWRCSATRTWPPPPTPCPRCCRTSRSPSRASTRGWSTWSLGAARRRPDLPRGGGWLFVEYRRRPPPRPRRGRGRSSPTAGVPAPRSSPARPSAALWRIREDGAGLGGRTPAGAGPAGLGGRGRAARAARRLPARLRGADGRARRRRPALRALRRRLRARPHRLPARRDRAAALPRVHRGRGPAGRLATAGRCPASTATAGPAASCCRSCTRRGDRPVRRGQARSTRATCSTRACSSTRPRSTPTCGWPAAAPPCARPAAYPRRRRLLRGRAPLHRRRQVPGRQHRLGRRDVPVLPGDAGREGLHPGPRAGAAGDRQRRAARRLAHPRSRRRSTCACPARAAPPTARPASTWPPTRPRRSTSGTGASSARVALRARLAAPLGAADPRRTAGQRDAALRGSLAALAKARWRHRPAPGPARVRPELPLRRRRAGQRPRPPGTSTCCSGSTRSPTLRAAGGHAAVAVLEAAGFEVPSSPSAVCCGLTWISTGQLDGARRILSRADRRAAPAVSAGIPVVGLEPSCTAALRADAAELLPTTPRAEVAPGSVTLAELLADAAAGLDPARPVRRHGGRPAALPPARGPRLGRRQGAARAARGDGHARSAAAAAWRATSASSAATTTCPSPSPRTPCCPPSARPGPDAVVLADGFSCRTQLDQLAGRPGVHLAELLLRGARR